MGAVEVEFDMFQEAMASLRHRLVRNGWPGLEGELTELPATLYAEDQLHIQEALKLLGPGAKIVEAEEDQGGWLVPLGSKGQWHSLESLYPHNIK